jgi:hypothetical protein
MESFSLAPLTGSANGAPAQNPFAPPPSSQSIDLLTGLPPGAAPQAAPPQPPPPPSLPRETSGARFVAPEDKEPSLELGSAPPRRPSASASTALSSRMSATSSARVLAIDSEAASDAYRIRCDKHGLFYDTRKASGCAKCLAPGRRLNAQLERRAPRLQDPRLRG